MNNKKRKKIGIDARFYGPVGKGLGRYTEEVVNNLLGIDRENDYVIFLVKENFETFKSDNPRVKKVLADVRWYTLKEQILMPWYIWREKIDLMHFHHFNIPILCPTKFVVTIHDLILIKYPSLRSTRLSPFLYKIKNTAYRFALNFAVRRSKRIIAVSEFTKNDILDNFSINPEKLVVSYEGVSKNLLGENTKDENKSILEKYKIDKPYLLYVGNAYPHKNLEWLLDIFYKDCVSMNIDLVLVGKEDYFFKRLKEIKTKREKNNISSGRVIFPGYVPDIELRSLFQEAIAYVFPSKYEGFGIPPLEAMANKCPVISSNRASMPEILGEAALYFNPDNKGEFLNILDIILKNTDLREDLVKRGLKQIDKYSWLDCAKTTKKVLEESL